jgi:hypothetical protein
MPISVDPAEWTQEVLPSLAGLAADNFTAIREAMVQEVAEWMLALRPSQLHLFHIVFDHIPSFSLMYGAYVDDSPFSTWAVVTIVIGWCS